MMVKISPWRAEAAVIEQILAPADSGIARFRITQAPGQGVHWAFAQLTSETANCGTPRLRIALRNIDAAGVRLRIADSLGKQANWWIDFGSGVQRNPNPSAISVVATAPNRVFLEVAFADLNCTFPVWLGLMLLGPDFALEHPGEQASIIVETVEMLDDRGSTLDRFPGVRHSRHSEFGRAAYLLCRGRGLEIGALYKPFDLDAEVVYLDKEGTDVLRRRFANDPNVGTILQVQLVWKGNVYPFLDNDAFDFVISSHVLEHVPNPGRQLKEWLRVARPGGIIYMVVPDKRFCFDRRREITPTEYLLGIYDQNLETIPIERYRDFLTGTDGEDGIVRNTSEEFVEQCCKSQSDIHVHTFTAESLLKFLSCLQSDLSFDVVHHQAQALHIHVALQKQ